MRCVSAHPHRISSRLTCFFEGPGDIGQYELSWSGQGTVTGTRVRGWSLKACEGAVADDATGTFHVAEEDPGIWKLPAEPTDPTPPLQILKVGENGLVADLERLTLAKFDQGAEWLVISSQGSNSFRVFESRAPHQFVGPFTIAGAVAFDGIDLSTRQLGSTFPRGAFGCHTDVDGHPILLADGEQIRQQLVSQAKTNRRSGH
ncbi:phytase [Schlesneria paludicola]|uniref:phytase n=1 Tax=Schlesneria paludicola TaxID=360056 RepID=UPI0021BBC092|nr:phytase [Schlesneria paludicola]